MIADEARGRIAHCAESRIVFLVLGLVHPVPSDPPELGPLVRDTTHMSRTQHRLTRGYCR